MSESTLVALQKSMAQRSKDRRYKQLIGLGIEVGKLYTDHGLPLDMALERLEHPKDQKLIILDGACQWFIQHKRNSGATEKAIERQRIANRKIIEAFTAGHELGVY